MKKFNYLLAVPMIVCAGALSACSDNPPQATTTTTETVQGTVPAQQAAPGAMQVVPGTVTTQTTHAETVPAQ